MKILITGGKGYIGQYLAGHFSGEDVYITTRTPSGPNERRMLLEDGASIEGVCRDMDVVIHTASMDERRIPDNPREALLVNTYGTRLLYLDAVKCGVKQFIYFSTFHVYGRTEPLITEETETEPISDYGMTHLFAEKYIRQLQQKNHIKTAVLRLTNGVGLPGRGVDKWYLVVNDFCRNAVRDHKIVLKSNGLPRRDFVSIVDICGAVECVIKNEDDYEIYNVSSEETVSIREIAFMVRDAYRKITGQDVELNLPDVSEEEIAQVKDFTVSSEKLRRLGWIPTETIRSSVENILKYELEAGEDK